MTDKMIAAVYAKPNEVVVKEVEIPEQQEGWCKVKVSYCGICGTDLNIYGGTHPRATAPLIMGHEFSGQVYGHPTIADGTNVTVNPLLYCGTCKPCVEGVPHVCETLRLIGIDRDGAMAEWVTVPNEAIVPLPNTMSLKLGALVEPFAVAVHAVRESRYKPGDCATVFGAGPIGLCVALVLKYFGATEVTVVEVNEFRRDLASRLSFPTVDPTRAEIPKNDLVFDCAAHPTVAEKLVDVTHVRGEIMIVGTYKKPTPLDLQNVNFKELTVKGTRVYTHKDFEVATALLTAHNEALQLITHEERVEKTDFLFQQLVQGRDIVKALIAF